MEDAISKTVMTGLNKNVLFVMKGIKFVKENVRSKIIWCAKIDNIQFDMSKYSFAF